MLGMRYRTLDGIQLQGKTARDVMQALRDVSWVPRSTLDEYMLETAKASRVKTGGKFRTSSAEDLLEDLQTAGLILGES
jgi:hypothetical protein